MKRLNIDGLCDWALRAYPKPIRSLHLSIIRSKPSFLDVFLMHAFQNETFVTLCKEVDFQDIGLKVNINEGRVLLIRDNQRLLLILTCNRIKCLL